MMNILRITVFYLLFATPIFGQFEGFYQTYDYAYGEHATDITQTSDGGFCMLGRYGVSFSTDSLLIIKTDSLGNEEWHKSYNFGNFNHPGTILQTADGGYIFSGGHTGEEVSSENLDGFIVKINSIGNVIWLQELGIGGLDMLNEICRNSDNIYYVAGAGRENSQDDFNGRIVKFDVNGIILGDYIYMT